MVFRLLPCFSLETTKAAESRHNFADIPLQVLIHGKDDCIENMKEIGNKFSHGMLCAGGKKKGTCFVRTTFLDNISLINYHLFEILYNILSRATVAELLQWMEF